MVDVYGTIKILLSLLPSDDTWEEISPGKSRNTMKMEHLSRAELNTELECQVANDDDDDEDGAPQQSRAQHRVGVPGEKN